MLKTTQSTRSKNFSYIKERQTKAINGCWSRSKIIHKTKDLKDKGSSLIQRQEELLSLWKDSMIYTLSWKNNQKIEYQL